MPIAEQERQVGAGEVRGRQAHHPRVERDDDRLVAGGLGALDEARRQLVVVGPVELVPARRVAQVARRCPPSTTTPRCSGTSGRRPRPPHARPRARRRGAGSTARRPGASITGARISVPSTVVARSRVLTSREHPRHERATVEGGAVGAASCAPRRRHPRRRRTPPARAPRGRAPRGPRRWSAARASRRRGRAGRSRTGGCRKGPWRRSWRKPSRRRGRLAQPWGPGVETHHDAAGAQ